MNCGDRSRRFTNPGAVGGRPATRGGIVAIPEQNHKRSWERTVSGDDREDWNKRTGNREGKGWGRWAACAVCPPPQEAVIRRPPHALRPARPGECPWCG